MSTATSTTPTYLLGSSDFETRRLMQQARMFNPLTRRILADAGIAEGMHVLDAGSGAGDVALLAAELVGPRGSVVGVDRNAEVLSMARERVDAAGLDNVTFMEGDLLTVSPPGRFDAVVGRLVLIHCHEPLNVLSNLMRSLRPGGIVAFQEYNFTSVAFQCSPPIPLWEQSWGWIRSTMERIGVQLQMGYDLYRVYQEAGLETSAMRLESPLIHGPDWEPYQWYASTLRSMLPLTEKLGIVSADEIDLDSLAERLRAETLAANAVIKPPELIGAWARKPGA